MNNFESNFGFEFECQEVSVRKSKDLMPETIQPVDIDTESFVTLLEQDGAEATTTSTFGSSFDSRMASHTESNISTKSSFSSSPPEHPLDYSDHYLVHEQSNFLPPDHPMEFMDGTRLPEQLCSTSSIATEKSSNHVNVNHGHQSCAINIAVLGLGTTGTHHEFDRYAQSAFSDFETQRHFDVDSGNELFKSVLSNDAKTGESSTTVLDGARGMYPMHQDLKTAEIMEAMPIHGREEKQHTMGGTAEHTAPNFPPNSSKNENKAKRKTKRTSETDTPRDKQKYKRRKDLSYESVVTDMAEQKDICLRCQVCSGVASGYHYGAETCGACKIFFRRNATKPPRHTCGEKPDRTNCCISCPGCRLQKSIEIGMDIAASRKGRYSYKRRYEYHRRSVQQVQAVQRQKTGQEVIIFNPTKSSGELVDLANRISDMFLSCGTYSPNFFDTLGDIERKFYETKLVNETAYGKMEPLNDERYKHIFAGTGLDIDGRQQAYQQRFLSFERRIRSYVMFAKKLHGFNELPKEDQESMFRYSCPYIACLSEYRACIVKKGIRIHPEGFVENADDIRELYSEDYVDSLFRVAGKIQAMNYTENERNLLKLIGFFASEFCVTAEGVRLATKHQDFVVKAFDKLIRINRKDVDCAKVIADSIMILADIREIKEKASTTFNSIVTKFPFLTPSPLIKEIIDIQEVSSG